MFREATSDDLPTILTLLRQMNPDDPELDDVSASRIFSAIRNIQGHTLFVVESEGQVLATASLNVVPTLTRSGSWRGIVENVVVDERHRRNGIGSRLMSDLLAVAWQAGCYKVSLTTDYVNPETHGFYTACGLVSGDLTTFVARR